MLGNAFFVKRATVTNSSPGHDDGDLARGVGGGMAERDQAGAAAPRREDGDVGNSSRQAEPPADASNSNPSVSPSPIHAPHGQAGPPVGASPSLFDPENDFGDHPLDPRLRRIHLDGQLVDAIKVPALSSAALASRLPLPASLDLPPATRLP